MSDLKDLCDRLVADAPPMAEGAAVLAVARRSAARHRLRLAGAGAAVAVVVGAVAALGVQGGLPLGRGENAPAASATPSRERIDKHQQKMYKLLEAALPAGYTIAPKVATNTRRPTTAPSFTGSPSGPGPELFASARAASTGPRRTLFVTSAVVGDGRGEGSLSALLWLGDRDDYTGCWTSEYIRCDRLVVDGVTVEVKTTRDARGVTIWTTVEVPDGQLQISAHQSYWASGPEQPTLTPKLDPFPFTPQWIADRAADPRFADVD